MDFIEEVENSSPALGTASGIRTRSVHRLTYEAEVAVIKRQHGDLEIIRKRLGLTRRQMCLNLLVDPSAWTRWTRGKSDAPPHVYRALALMLEKSPKESDAPSSVESMLQFESLESELGALKSEIRELKELLLAKIEARSDSKMPSPNLASVGRSFLRPKLSLLIAIFLGLLLLLLRFR